MVVTCSGKRETEAAQQGGAGGCSHPQNENLSPPPNVSMPKCRLRSRKLVWQNIQPRDLFTNRFIRITLCEIL